MKKGEQFEVVDDTQKWYVVRNSAGGVGKVPSNYLKKIGGESPTAAARRATPPPKAKPAQDSMRPRTDTFGRLARADSQEATATRPSYDERPAQSSDQATPQAAVEATATSEAMEITLIRGAKGFGFSFVTEKGRHFIKQMTPETQASGLRARDELVEVNSQRTLNCDHGQVKQMVINSPPRLVMSLLR